MCEGESSGLIRKQIVIADNAKRTVIAGPWMLSHGADTLRIMQDLRQEVGSIEIEPYLRFASTRTDRPDTWTATGDTRDQDGAETNDTDISTTTDKLWVQPAIRASTGDNATAEGLVSMLASTEGKGRIIAARTFDIQPTLNSSQAMYIPLAEPHLALGFTSYMFAVLLFGVDGTVSYLPAWRAYNNGLDDPQSWNDHSGGAQTSADYNSDTWSFSPGSGLFLQPGLKLVSTGGRAQARILVSAV